MSQGRRQTLLMWYGAICVISFALFTQGYLTSVQAATADAEVLLAQATVAYEQHEYDKALTLLLEANTHDPGNPRVYYYLGLVHLAKKQPAQAVPYLEKGLEINPSNFYLKYQLGVAHFANGDYDKADPLLTETFEERPDLDSLGFYVGYCRYRQKDYEGAMKAFERCQTDDYDTDQLVHFYRGMTLGVLGLSDQAVQELEGVRQDQAVTPFASAAVRMRERLAANKKVDEKNRFRFQMSIGAFYDDNVAINPDPVGVLPGQGVGGAVNQNTAITNLRFRNTTSAGFLTSLLGEYAFYRQGPWEGIASGSFFQTVNTGDNLGRLNVREFTAGLGGFYRGEVAQRPFQVGLQYRFAYLFLDEAAFLMRNRPTLSGTLVGPSFDLPFIGNVGNLTTAVYRFEYKTFFSEVGDTVVRFAEQLRDGHNNMVGLLHAFRFKQDTILFRLGYQFDVEDTDGRTFRYTGNKFLTGWQVSLPWGEAKVSYDYDVHWRAYSRPQTLFTDKNGVFAQRNDRQHTHVLQVVKPLPYDFSVAVQYQRVRNVSNIPIFDYQKNVYSLIISWNYD